MAWLMVGLAGIFEIIWAYAMKRSDGFSKLCPSMITLIFMLLSFTLLSYAMRSLPLGTAYTVWSGIGAVGSFVVGILVLNEPMNLTRVMGVMMIVGGMILMKVTTSP